MVTEHVETIKKINHFSIQRIVFPTGCTEKFGLNDQYMVLGSNSITCEANHFKFETLMHDSCGYKS